ncbi:MAG: hypothetical protein ACI37R_04960 [Candidatus Avigastranaerophilus sp.]
MPISFRTLFEYNMHTNNITSQTTKTTQTAAKTTQATSTSDELVLSNSKQSDSNSFSAWINDEDKVCTDGSDDGKLSVKEALTSFGKGLAGIVKTAVKHPIATVATVAAGVGLTVLTGGAALPVMAAVGTAIGTGTIVYGGYKAATAETDGEAKQAFETIGNGTFALATSALGAKSSLNAASKAGVSAAQNADDMNIVSATAQTFKVIPEAIKVSGINAKANITTWTTGVVQANSNAIRNGQVQYMSKANEAQAYRFNPNGTPDEIVANNPGVFQGDDGSFYVKNKWNADAPFKIDNSKEQMIMMYDGMDDMAVCDGAIFEGSYVDTKTFKSSGSLNYQNPANLEYGAVVDVTKQAPGAFTSVATGTKVQTLEGITTVQEGQVIALDHAGNPYVTSAANVAKRNIPLEGYETAFEALNSIK